jgi:NADH-quinone oxidoreductase subunit L
MPPFAGFFSKDEILWYAWASPYGSKFLWLIGALAAFCTAFYMTRLMALTFWGGSRVPKEVHPHESPLSMTVPLIVLAVLSAVGGWIGIPHVISAILPGHPGNFLHHWLEHSVPEVHLLSESAVAEWALMGISVLGAGISALVAYRFYVIRPDMPKEVARKLAPVYEAVSNKYFVDEFYFGRIINPLIEMSRGLWAYVDVNFIDKTTYWLSDLVKGAGGGLRQIQNGNLQQYALYITLGIVGVILFLFVG